MNQPKLPRSFWIAVSIPWLGIAIALAALAIHRMDYASWERYRDFWNGNASEVYSHWLNMVMMSGNAILLASLVAIEASFRPRVQDVGRLHRTARRTFWVALILTGIAGTQLDHRDGEGTVLISFVIFFVPILTFSYYLLRKSAAHLRWNVTATHLFCASFAILHFAAQLYYEPSQTGAPSSRIAPVWFVTVTLGLGWAFVASIRNGKLARMCKGTFLWFRKPAIWIPLALVILALSFHAHRLHTTNSEFAIDWLDDLEVSLSDELVAQLKSEMDPNAANHDKMPVPALAEMALNDTRSKTNNSLRIFIPLNQTNYLFLWTNSRFKYCDKRSLSDTGSVQMDQEFIDALIERGGTHQTGMYSGLWSPYLAGRVLKDKSGAVKAICVINTADD